MRTHHEAVLLPHYKFFFHSLGISRNKDGMTIIEVLNKLKLAGLPDKQAEAIVEAFEGRDRSWFETQFEKLRGEIKDAKFQMIFWIVGSFSLATVINHLWK